MHEDEIESKSWISSKLFTVKLSQGDIMRNYMY